MMFRSLQARKDAQLLLGALLFLWWLGAHFDFFEYMHEQARYLEVVELDELLMALIILSAGLFWFAVRRWREQEASARALRISEERFSYAMQGANDGLWDWNLLTDEVYYSPRWKSMLGYREEELEATLDTWASLVHPDEKVGVLARARAYMNGGAGDFQVEMRMRHKDGHWVTVLSRAYLIRDHENHQPIRLVGTHVDISERIAAAQALEESRKRLADAQKLAQIGNWELDILNNDLSWSDEVFRIFEVDPERFGASYETFLRTIHPEDRDRVNRVYTDSVAHHKPYGIDHRLLMPDGRVKYVYEWCETRYDEHGEPVRSVGTVQDVTEIKELELQLFQSQKMEALGTLVGGIAHDFNNILAAIDGNIYLARRKTESPEVMAKLQAIETLECRAAELVKQLLTFARKDDVSLQVLSLKHFLEDAFALVRVAIPERIGLQLEVCEEELSVRGDTTQLQQVLLNLLGNARDALAGREDGVIRCTLSSQAPSELLRQRFPAMYGERFACLAVADNGHGIRAVDMERIFEPFYTTKEVGKGTGLGLSMVYSVVERAGGAVDVESRSGDGSIFRIYLPLADKVFEETHVYEPETVISGRGEQVLVVDDEYEVRATTAEVLRNLGYSVLEAENGREAVAVFEQHPNRIRLIVMDLVMPGIGGVEAAEAIRSINEDVPIIFVTGYDRDEEMPQERLPDNAVVINKPFPFETFSYMLNRFMQQVN